MRGYVSVELSLNDNLRDPRDPDAYRFSSWPFCWFLNQVTSDTFPLLEATIPISILKDR